MPWPSKRRLIGTKVPRIDGPQKATGRAKYSFDVNRPGMLYAKILRSPHAHARIKNIDIAAAEKTPGYRALHLFVKPGTEVFFAGAEIAAIAADTEEHAEDCFRAIQVDYEVLPHLVKEEDALRSQERTVGPKSNVEPGGEYATDKFETQAYQNVDQVSEGQYGVPVICHQCLESHGLVAEWNKEQTELTIWSSTQNVSGMVTQFAQYFKIPPAQVRCLTPHMGGGYGSKFSPGPEGEAAALLARKTKAAVKLMLDRAEEVSVGGMRPSASGTVKMAATKEGTIRAYEVICQGTPGVGRGATVNLDYLPYVYSDAIPHIKRQHKVIRLNIQSARAMRAPGHPQNCFLTDQALDDLAARLKMDPLQLRLKNLPPNDPQAVKTAPLSLAALRHTIYSRELEIAAKLSDWNKKWHPPGRGDNGTIKHGMGMAIHTWGGAGYPNNDTKVTISADGSVLAQCSTQDLGTAQRTVLAIVVAEVLGLEPKDITVQIGDSSFGRSTPSGGSTTCPGTAPAALNAATAARDALFQAIAERLKAQPGDLVLEAGRVVNRSNNQGMPWKQACARLGGNTAVGNGNWTPGLSNQGVGGVQVAEVKVDTETGVVRCTKVVAVQDCGMVINKQGCESQVAGGVIMAVNYALFEEAIYDRRTGRLLNADMEFYKLGGIQDMPQIVVHMMDMPERGVIGIGEPPTISTTAAVGNALFNALGVRVPNAPFTPERVLATLATRKGEK